MDNRQKTIKLLTIIKDKYGGIVDPAPKTPEAYFFCNQVSEIYQTAMQALAALESEPVPPSEFKTIDNKPLWARNFLVSLREEVPQHYDRINLVRDIIDSHCLDCQKPSVSPSEFTKKWLKFNPKYVRCLGEPCEIAHNFKRACKHIDSQTATIKNQAAEIKTFKKRIELEEPNGITGNIKVEEDTVPSRIDHEVLIANQAAIIKGQVLQLDQEKRINNELCKRLVELEGTGDSETA